MSLAPRDLLRLAAESGLAVNTVRRRLAGHPVRPATATCLDAAARKLGLKLPRKAAAKRGR